MMCIEQYQLMGDSARIGIQTCTIDFLHATTEHRCERQSLRFERNYEVKFTNLDKKPDSFELLTSNYLQMLLGDDCYQRWPWTWMTAFHIKALETFTTVHAHCI